jgi:uncharacterized protein YbdZ (MbtH family)
VNLQESDREDTTTYKAVVNHEEQYSIWPSDRENAPGWRDAGKSGTKAECLAYIKEVWTDQRPLSLRLQMEEDARNPPPPPTPKAPRRPCIVERLSGGAHTVVLDTQPEQSGPALKGAIEREYVHVKFTGTDGGTTLGLQLDLNGCDLSAADFAGRTGTAHLEGELVLNYVKVRCLVDLDLPTLAGTGRLVQAQG